MRFGDAIISSASLRPVVAAGLSLDAFEPAYRRSRVYLRLTGTGVGWSPRSRSRAAIAAARA